MVDAGGGTFDISSYVIKDGSPLLVEEIARPDCVSSFSFIQFISDLFLCIPNFVSGLLSGSAFVTLRARSHLERRLENSKYCTLGILDHIVKLFDEIPIRSFSGRDQSQYLPFGSPLDKDTSAGVHNGKLRLTG